MYSLLVLGLVPGTDIQINFQAWLILVIIAAFIGRRAWKYARQLSSSVADSLRLPVFALMLYLNPLLQNLYQRAQWIARTAATLPTKIAVDR